MLRNSTIGSQAHCSAELGASWLLALCILSVDCFLDNLFVSALLSSQLYFVFSRALLRAFACLVARSCNTYTPFVVSSECTRSAGANGLVKRSHTVGFQNTFMENRKPLPATGEGCWWADLRPALFPIDTDIWVRI